MKSLLSKVTLAVLLLIFLTTGAIYGKKKVFNAQTLSIPDSNNVQIVKTHTGMTVIGRITEIQPEYIAFSTSIGEVTINYDDIQSIKEIPANSLRKGKYWFPNPNATRLFFAPTGRMQTKNEGYFADYYVLIPMVAYGITDWLGIGGGFSFVPFIQMYEQAMYIMPRVGIIQAEKFAWCGGILAAKLPVFDDVYRVLGAGLVYTSATYGTRDASITAGTGYGFMYDYYWLYETDSWHTEWTGLDWPIFMIGGEYRYAPRASLVTENWIVPDIEEGIPVFLSYGSRFFGENISVDLGFIVPFVAIEEEISIFPGIPYVDFVYNF